MQIQIESQTFNISEHFAKQIPWATALALTRTAKDAQKRIVDDLPKRFHLKNGWTARMIKIVPATKANHEAQVTAPGYMAKQEQGGTRKPEQGVHLASPGQSLRGRLIPKAMRPGAAFGKPRTFMLYGKGGKEAIAQRRSKGSRQFRILYWLTETQEYDKRFQMLEAVEITARSRFAKHFMEALQAAR